MYSYAEAVHYLNTTLPMFSRVGEIAVKRGLGNIERLCSALGNPQQRFPSVHIAGTNGKGSTSHMIAGALQHAGYRTGLYTSPHLVDLRERVRINGVPVPEQFVIDFVEKTKDLVKEIEPSYFELNVAMAFLAFAEEKVDIAVIETGLGGRLDSTNIILPVLSVITNIGLDHTEMLGDTLALIATEKAGIIKEKVPVVIGETHPETEQVFFLNALSKGTAVLYADSIWELVRTGQDIRYQYYKAIHKGEQKIYDLRTDLMGDFQAHNIKTVLTACAVLAQSGWKLPQETVLESLASVKKTTGLRGRWEIVQQNPFMILDVAHNADGLQYLQRNLETLNLLNGDHTGTLHIICGFVNDKDVRSAFSYFPKDAVYYFTQADVPRAMPFEKLAGIGAEKDLKGLACATVRGAMAESGSKAGEHDLILITGSFFIVGEALAILEEQLIH